MNEIEYLLSLAHAVQQLKLENPRGLITTSPRSKRLLAETFEALRRWEEWSQAEPSEWSGTQKGLTCSYCNASIVLAREDEISSELIAFETETVLASGLPPSYNWQLSFATNPPHAHANLGLRTGTVWLRHELACGALSRAGLNNSIYRRRYATNVQGVAEAMTNVSLSLVAKLRHIQRSVENENHGD